MTVLCSVRLTRAALGLLAFLLASSAGVRADDASPLSSPAIVPDAVALDRHDPHTVDGVRAIVRDLLLAEPELVQGAFAELQRRQAEAAAERARVAVKANADLLFAHPLSPVSGNPDGDVTLVEFFDYNCGYCKKVSPEVAAVMASDAGLRVVWKEFPVLGADSRFAARASMAAERQGRFLVFHKALMAVDDRLSEDLVLRVADRAGLDRTQLLRDMADPAIEAYLSETAALAQRLGITGTPAFVIGPALVPGAVPRSELSRLIEVARAGDT